MSCPLCRFLDKCTNDGNSTSVCPKDIFSKGEILFSVAIVYSELCVVSKMIIVILVRRTEKTNIPSCTILIFLINCPICD